MDPLGSVPIYQQIRDEVVRGIARGELVRGEPLASVRSLAGAFAINPATVTKAYDLLRSEGFVATNAKSGTFVAHDRTDDPPGDFTTPWRARLAMVLAEARAQGLTSEQIADISADVASAVETKE